MKLDKVRRLAADVLNTSLGRVWLDPMQSEKIQSVMTKEDVRALARDGIIKRLKKNAQSSGRAKMLKKKKRKGRKRGHGKRKGGRKARSGGKRNWIARIRAQRQALAELRKKMPEAVKKAGYQKVYRMIKGNYFKGKAHVETYVKGRVKK